MISDDFKRAKEADPEIGFVIPSWIAEQLHKEWGGLPDYFHVMDVLPKI